ncbi:3-isopropylmalate dehydratase large subunit [Candidatus Sumerlaeota bacterium]|nr:3-isopropylmalate dehydratase large subunit [Candidatus Sumerlaeota bacterium]
MAMTMTEKILARHAGRDRVEPGDNIWVTADVLMTHDVCGPGTIGVFNEHFGPEAKVWDRQGVVIIPDHYIFTEDEKARRNVDILREFVKAQDLPYFYDPGTRSYRGVCHVALPHEGHARPGEVLFGTDSHTCTHGAFGEFATGIGNTDAGLVMGTGKLWVKVPPTMRFVFEGELPPYLMAKDLILHVIGDIGVDGATYRAIEFAGDTVRALSIDERMTLCNMAIEAGGKNGIIAADDKTRAYVADRTSVSGTKTEYEEATNDPDAKFLSEKTYRTAQLEPVVAQPHSPDRKSRVRDVAGTRISRVYIGSCTGGKIADFIAAAQILDGRKVEVETFIVPATVHVDEALDSEKVNGRSLRDIFADAECQIGPPSCAACLGGPPDTFGRTHSNEVVVSTTNRNFPARMGSKDSAVYLASPLTAAASALHGVLTDPRDEM